MVALVEAVVVAVGREELHRAPRYLKESSPLLVDEELAELEAAAAGGDSGASLRPPLHHERVHRRGTRADPRRINRP